MTIKVEQFWDSKALDEMSFKEWESLCDGCGRCCLHKLEDIDTGLYFYTNVACRLLDAATCRCSNYLQRRTLVEDCVLLSPSNEAPYQWLPVSCAYRRIAEGKGLAWWHPLVSGNPETVHQAGISVRKRTVSEITVSEDTLEDHIISWIDF
jgi:uncharacterized cysteine cluster protein YcgN (CxxCxxCC family)